MLLNFSSNGVNGDVLSLQPSALRPTVSPNIRVDRPFWIQLAQCTGPDLVTSKKNLYKDALKFTNLLMLDERKILLAEWYLTWRSCNQLIWSMV